MNKERRRYDSPVRQEKARQTRERILESVGDWLQLDSPLPLTLDAIARHAGVERRTVFRIFQTKEALLAAFWVWINDRIVSSILPRSLNELIEAPTVAFPAFDAQEGVIRASLHTSAGRAMRLQSVPARREAFRAVLNEVGGDVPAEDFQNLEAAVHLLYSASAWETMRDYAGVDGAQAGRAASWAIRTLVDSLRPSIGGDQPRTQGETSMSSTVTVQHLENAPTRWVVRDRVRFMGALPGTDLSIVEIDVPPGSGTPPHTHASMETFCVLSGEITFGSFGDVAAQTVTGAGGVVTVPSGVPHNYQNNSGKEAKMLVVLDQQMIDFFHELGKESAPPAGPPSDEEIAEVIAVCQRHGIHFLGQPGG